MSYFYKLFTNSKMGRMRILLLHVRAPPIEICFDSKLTSVNAVVCKVLHVQSDELRTIDVADGNTIYTQVDKLGANHVASNYLQKHNDGSTEVKGPCIIVGGVPSRHWSLDKEVIGYIQKEYKTVLGIYKKNSRKPKRKLRDIDFFSSEFHKQKGIESTQPRDKKEFGRISSQVRPAWNSLPEEKKDTYRQMCAVDSERYEKEMVVWTSNNPMPPLPPKSAYSIFCNENQGSTDSWKTLDKEIKDPFILKSIDDKQRYKCELEQYKIWCLENNIQPADYKKKSLKKRKLLDTQK